LPLPVARAPRHRPDLVGDFYHALGDQRACDRGAEQVFALIEGIGAEHRKHEVTHEFFLQIVDEDLLHAHLLRLGTRWSELFALAMSR